MGKSTTKPTPAEPNNLTIVLRWVVAGVAGFALLLCGWLAGAYLSSPAPIRQPAHDHYHFRLQVVADGKPVNFASAKFQTPFDKDICTADLTAEPFHFHDQLDQFAHVHWAGMTGGLFLKNYGWEFVGGIHGLLGYRFDHLPRLVAVPMHGQALPDVSSGTRFFIYTGDEKGYVQRDWDQFLNMDLREFFAGGQPKPTSLLDQLIPAAAAHNGVEHDGHAEAAEGASEAELAELNDLIGNAVIFTGSEPPTPDQIKDRFNNLIALPESACAG